MFTATEAGGAGIRGARYWSRKANSYMAGLKGVLKNTVTTTAMIFTMLIGAMIFGYFLTASGVTAALVNFVSGLHLSSLGILIVILLMYNVLGCLMDAAAITLITMPLVFPVSQSIGIDPILFGCLFVINMEMALITPPIAMNVFVISGMIKEDSHYYDIQGGLHLSPWHGHMYGSCS